MLACLCMFNRIICVQHLLVKERENNNQEVHTVNVAENFSRDSVVLSSNFFLNPFVFFMNSSKCYIHLIYHFHNLV